MSIWVATYWVATYLWKYRQSSGGVARFWKRCRPLGPESTFVCGIIGAAGELGDLDINPLVGLLHHRGPDEHGYVATDNVQFG